MKKLLLSISLFLFVLSISMGQTTVNINPDKDNSIYAETTTNSNGLGSLYNGVNGVGFANRSLLHFDIAGTLPANATITDVNLILDLHRRASGAVGEDFSLHVLLQDWGEGVSLAGDEFVGGGGAGAVAIAPDATWTDAMVGTSFWGVAGGDFVVVPSATTNVAGLGVYIWTSGTMIVDVQTWYDNPAINFGWILKIDDEGIADTAAAFGSKDQGVMPILEVTYTTTLGLEDNSLSQVSIYPNPVKHNLVIKTPSGLNIDKIRLFNLLGQQIIEMAPNTNGNPEVDLSELQSGVYLVELSSNNQTVVRRIIKE